ncbi:hypothetical protein Curi_c00180 [Gottschalkia acidurici 9a]|uniref:DUF3793 domain-containing protein n=1 Tax=Gottschalkia acidurici (strain ATCC 7906 / DSM 604 / BCRC 14475 / CIP 104303 / KCTC 5404 / NCIMB 10678 / 9a) TaxID=1128398 RepID=K0AWJ1_GOTA9|nr:DUF3793 family protein [Gottschalkia acidurici]AFS77100.1 hypothetical protein Curi_c00180 [Gottschalkia acidurici 9a]
MSIEKMKVDFFRKINCASDLEYMRCFITYMISPVITGIKPSSTVSLNNNIRNMYNTWKIYGEDLLNEFGLDSIKLKESSETAIILIYNRKLLEDHLLIDKNRSFLCKLGYGENLNIDHCLNCLKDKFADVEFPDESGIFLGIPIEDVLGFMSNKDCLFCGYWKVYDNYDRAQKVFRLYDNSKRAIISSVLRNKELNLVHKNINHIYRSELYTVVNS